MGMKKIVSEMSPFFLENRNATSYICLFTRSIEPIWTHDWDPIDQFNLSTDSKCNAHIPSTYLYFHNFFDAFLWVYFNC